MSLHVKEEKLRSAENRIKKLEKSNNNKQTKQISTTSSGDDATSYINNDKSNKSQHPKDKKIYNENNAIQENLGVNSINEERPVKDNESSIVIQRTKNFTEKELNDVRSALQMRLNELEPLPELLKNMELKYHEAIQIIKSNEAKLLEYERVNNTLGNDLQNTKSKYESLKQKLKDVKSNLEQKELTRVVEEIKKTETNVKNVITETKIDPGANLDQQNKELLRQLGLKEDLIKDLSVN